MDVATELRKHQRMRTLKDGQLISEYMTSLIDVKIRDLSPSGARVETKSVINLPAAFTLSILSQNVLYPCRARWRRGMQIGIEFTGPPRPNPKKVIVIPAHAGIPFRMKTTTRFRHPGVRRDPGFPNVYWLQVWVPTFVGMTEFQKARRDPGFQPVNVPKLQAGPPEAQGQPQNYWNKMVPRVFGYMDIGKTALIRAFELARSGKCLNISELLLRLTAERYDASQIQGPSLRKQLAELIKVAKRPL